MILSHRRPSGRRDLLSAWERGGRRYGLVDWI